MEHLADERGGDQRRHNVQDERRGDHEGLRLGKAARVSAHIEATVGAEPRRAWKGRGPRVRTW